MKTVAPLCALALVAACGEEVDPSAELEAALAYGPHAVGVRELDVEYTPWPGAKRRRSLTFVFYPAAAGQRGEPATFVLRNADRAELDLAPLEGAEPRPVVLFSHGHQAYATVGSALAEHLASHGFVVLAPTHTGNTIGDGDARTSPIYALRPLDLSAALDAALAAPPASLAGPLGTRALALGHSFGGYTAYLSAGARHDVDGLAALCASAAPRRGYCEGLSPELEAAFRAGFRDPRVAGAVGLDPGDADLFGATGLAAVEGPVLHVLAERNRGPSDDPYWSGLEGEARARLVLEEGDHNDLVDSCAAGLDVRCSALPKQAVLRELRGRVLAFARAVLEEAADDPTRVATAPLEPGFFRAAP